MVVWYGEGEGEPQGASLTLFHGWGCQARLGSPTQNILSFDPGPGRGEVGTRDGGLWGAGLRTRSPREQPRFDAYPFNSPLLGYNHSMAVVSIRSTITNMITSAVQSLGFPVPSFTVEYPADASHGDLACNVAMLLAKELQRAPLDIAQEIVDQLSLPETISTATAVAPGFINFSLSAPYFQNEMTRLLAAPRQYGVADGVLSHTGTVVVEYSSANIAKPFGVGHLRSTIIGDAAANLLAFHGHTVVRDNHLGDWGTQFGKLLYALTTWGDLDAIEQSHEPIKELVALYVRFHDEAEKDDALDAEGRAWFKRLEDGDEMAHDVWQRCVDLSMKEFERIYARLGVSFDTTHGESFYVDRMPAVLDEVREKGALEESEGAQVIFLDDLPPLLVLKSDGATLYSLRDLATDHYRFGEYGAETLIINEVGAEQSLYFQQIFAAETLLGWCAPEQRVHLKHGLMRLKDKKMSTRKGDVIWLEELLDKAVEKAAAINPDVAEDVGIGAVKWNDLKNEARNDVVFDWDTMLALKGNTGPYIQYTHARALSVLRAAGDPSLTVDDDFTALTDAEHLVVLTLSRFPNAAERAARELAPHLLCTYLFELAQRYNELYAAQKFIGAERENRGLVLSLATAEVLSTGLGLLGIAAPEQM